MATDYYRGRLVTEYTATCAGCGTKLALGNQRSRGYAQSALRLAGWRAFEGTGWHCAACTEAVLAARALEERNRLARRFGVK